MNNNNNNEYNYKLYNSVFNNIYLKRIIFNHLTIYNILYNNIQFTSHEQWDQFKYKEYLNNITLNYKYNNIDQLPKNIKHIKFQQNNKEFIVSNLNSISNKIQSIKLSTLINSSELDQLILTTNEITLSKISQLHLFIDNIQDQSQLCNNIILKSVKELVIYGPNVIIRNGILTNNLKRVVLIRIKSIENLGLLESLKYASLESCSPSIINQISSNNLVNLHLDNLPNDKLISIIDSNIIFPESLQELSISCFSLNARLPNNIKSLKLSLFKLEDTIIFPSSLQNLKIFITHLNREIFKSKESVPYNLRSLEFGCSSIVDSNGQSILPDKLESLTVKSILNFNQVLQVNQIPSTLTFLDLGDSFNQVIDLNVLPSNLKTLKLGKKYNHVINPLAIPQQLEILEIDNCHYNHPINLPVSTHPNTLIDSYSFNLYYNSSNSSLCRLKLPNSFNSPLSTLQLQDKSSLEYLHLGFYFDQVIELSDLPINNNIKTLVLSYKFNQTINLGYFQNLETIILQEFSNPKITTTTNTNQQEIVYNNYNLKNIIAPNNNQFIINLDINFYQFLKNK